MHNDRDWRWDARCVARQTIAQLADYSHVRASLTLALLPFLCLFSFLLSVLAFSRSSPSVLLPLPLFSPPPSLPLSPFLSPLISLPSPQSSVRTNTPKARADSRRERSDEQTSPAGLAAAARRRAVLRSFGRRAFPSVSSGGAAPDAPTSKWPRVNAVRREALMDIAKSTAGC